MGAGVVLVALLSSCTVPPRREEFTGASIDVRLSAWAEGRLPREERESLAKELSQQGPSAWRHTESLVAILRQPMTAGWPSLSSEDRLQLKYWGVIGDPDLYVILNILDAIGRFAYLELLETDPNRIHPGSRHAVAFWLADGCLFGLLESRDFPEAWRAIIREAVAAEQWLPLRWFERLNEFETLRTARDTFARHPEELMDLRSDLRQERSSITFKLDAIILASAPNSEGSRASISEFVGVAAALSEEMWIAISLCGDRDLAEWVASLQEWTREGDRYWLIWALGTCGAPAECRNPFEHALFRAARNQASRADMAILLEGLRWGFGNPNMEKERILARILPFAGEEWIDLIAGCPGGQPDLCAQALAWIGTEAALTAVGQLEGVSDRAKSNAATLLTMTSKDAIPAHSLLRRWSLEGVPGLAGHEEWAAIEKSLMRRDPRLIEIVERGQGGD